MIYQNPNKDGDIIGPSMYYDLFSWWGLNQFYLDRMLIMLAPLIAIVLLAAKQ